MRKTVSEDKKRKKISFTIDPEIYEMWKQYCSERGIVNYSSYIEMIIKEKLEK